MLKLNREYKNVIWYQRNNRGCGNCNLRGVVLPSGVDPEGTVAAYGGKYPVLVMSHWGGIAHISEKNHRWLVDNGAIPKNGADDL